MTDSVQRKSSRRESDGKTSQKRFGRADYGVGEADASLVLVLLLLEEVPLLGEEPALTVVFVSVLLEPAGEGFTTVVLFSVFLSAGGAVDSVFCSQAASRDAAPARMQMYFFIVSRWMSNVG